MARTVLFIFLFISYIKANSFALVIGVDGNGLKGASNDAISISNLLTTKAIKNITIVKNEKATKNNILNKFRSIVERA